MLRSCTSCWLVDFPVGWPRQVFFFFLVIFLTWGTCRKISLTTSLVRTGLAVQQWRGEAYSEHVVVSLTWHCLAASLRFLFVLLPEDPWAPQDRKESQPKVPIGWITPLCRFCLAQGSAGEYSPKVLSNYPKSQPPCRSIWIYLPRQLKSWEGRTRPVSFIWQRRNRESFFLSAFDKGFSSLRINFTKPPLDRCPEAASWHVLALFRVG